MLPPEEPLLEAIGRTWAHHTPRNPGGLMQLLKWQLMGARADIVIYADLDVDLMPQQSRARASAVWAAALPTLMAARRAGVRAIVSADHVSPINAGQFVLLPDRSLYLDGLEVQRQSSCGE